MDSPTHWQARPLPWHHALFARVLSMYEQERLPHALMLVGPAGCGKTLFAGSLVAALMCRAPIGERPEGVPCGGCESCDLARAGSHGDMRWLEPEEGKRAIGIEPVREAIRFSQQTPAYGALKTLVVAPAEALTQAAANAILKTLEEPAGSSFICLVCNRPGDLPATVRSRCQSLACPAPDTEQALGWLTQQVGQADTAKVALEAAEGRVMDALALERGGALADITALRATLTGLMDGSASAAKVADSLLKVELDQVLETALAVLEQRLRVADAQTLLGAQAVFALRDDLARWSAAVRNGVNLAREGLLYHLCHRIETECRHR